MKNITTLAIIDDEALFRKGMALLTQQFEGIHLKWEGNSGQELMDHLSLRDASPDIVLMDIKTQTWDGVEIARLLIQKYPAIRLIILSSYFSKGFVIHLLELGAAAYLPKNSMPAEVEATIHAVAEKGFYYSEAVMEIVHENLKNKQQHALPNIGLKVSAREKDVLQLICEQYTNPEIADKLHISIRTVEWHRKNLLKKLKCRNIAGLVAFAIQQEMIQVNTANFWQKNSPRINTGF